MGIDIDQLGAYKLFPWFRPAYKPGDIEKTTLTELSTEDKNTRKQIHGLRQEAERELKNNEKLVNRAAIATGILITALIAGYAGSEVITQSVNTLTMVVFTAALGAKATEILGKTKLRRPVMDKLYERVNEVVFDANNTY